jgi:hypothetical protein
MERQLLLPAAAPAVSPDTRAEMISTLRRMIDHATSTQAHHRRIRIAAAQLRAAAETLTNKALQLELGSGPERTGAVDRTAESLQRELAHWEQLPTPADPETMLWTDGAVSKPLLPTPADPETITPAPARPAVDLGIPGDPAALLTQDWPRALEWPSAAAASCMLKWLCFDFRGDIGQRGRIWRRTPTHVEALRVRARYELTAKRVRIALSHGSRFRKCGFPGQGQAAAVWLILERWQHPAAARAVYTALTDRYVGTLRCLVDLAKTMRTRENLHGLDESAQAIGSALTAALILIETRAGHHRAPTWPFFLGQPWPRLVEAS